MHENAVKQLGLPPEAVNGSAPHNGHGPGAATDTARPAGGPSIGEEVLNHALSGASGWVASRSARGRQKEPMSRAAMQSWLLRAVFLLFAALVLGSFACMAIGLLSVTEASALLMPVVVLVAMSMGIFLGQGGD